VVPYFHRVAGLGEVGDGVSHEVVVTQTFLAHFVKPHESISLHNIQVFLIHPHFFLAYARPSAEGRLQLPNFVFFNNLTASHLK
jgi:hypothetical protein